MDAVESMLYTMQTVKLKTKIVGAEEKEKKKKLDVNLLMHEAKVLKVQNCGNHDAPLFIGFDGKNSDNNNINNGNSSSNEKQKRMANRKIPKK
jgi:hypothetical protein